MKMKKTKEKIKIIADSWEELGLKLTYDNISFLSKELEKRNSNIPIKTLESKISNLKNKISNVLKANAFKTNFEFISNETKGKYFFIKAMPGPSRVNRRFWFIGNRHKEGCFVIMKIENRNSIKIEKAHLADAYINTKHFLEEAEEELDVYFWDNMYNIFKPYKEELKL